METTPQIDFQGMEPSEAMRSRVMRHILRLEDHYGRMTACRVAIRAPSARHRTGGLYEIDIFLSLPDGRNASVGHTRQDDERFQRFDFAVDDAFDRAIRQLQDEIGRMRGQTKQHGYMQAGVVRRMMRDDGYGFLESDDGREIYFHRNAVLSPGFDRLEPGERVEFRAEDGLKGPQATQVSAHGARAPG